MARNRIKVYWLLLITLLFTAGMVLSVGEAQARYENTVAEDTIIEFSANGITSNCLVTEDQPPITVKLGSLSLDSYQPMRATFWLHSADTDAVGAVAWACQDEEHEKYVTLSLLSGADVLEPYAEVDLLKDVKLDLTLAIMPTILATSTAHEELTINVLVTWGDEMWGTFEVTLPEVVVEETEPSEPAEEEKDPETEPEGDPTQPTEEDPATVEVQVSENFSEIPAAAAAENDPPADGDNADPSTGTDDDVQGNNGGDSGDGNQGGSPAEGDDRNPTDEPSGETTEGDTGAEPPEEDPPGNNETIPPVETEPELPGEGEGNGEEEEEKKLPLETLERFDPDGVLPLKIHLPEHVTMVRLGLLARDDEGEASTEIDMLPFPDFTKYTYNDKAGYYMLYEGNTLDFTEFGEDDTLLVSLDFTQTSLADAAETELAMEFYAGGTLTERHTVAAVFDAQDSIVAAVLTEEELQAKRQAAEEGIEPMLNLEYTRSGHILNKGQVLDVALPEEWKEAEMEYSLDLLTMSDSSTLVYQPVSLATNYWAVEYINDDKMHNLVVQLGSVLPRAGTYRLTMKWNYEGVCYTQTQMTFFINYSGTTQTVLGS